MIIETVGQLKAVLDLMKDDDDVVMMFVSPGSGVIERFDVAVLDGPGQIVFVEPFNEAWAKQKYYLNDTAKELLGV